VAEEVSKYKVDLLGVQEVRWGGGGTEPAGEYTIFYKKGNENHELGTGFFVHKRIRSAVKKVEFISDRMSYIILRGRWCDIVLNVHAPTEDKIEDIKEMVGKPEGKRPLGRPRRRWVDNINMGLSEIGWDGMVWSGLIWLRIGTGGGLM
jgi:hypothetical protein